MSRLTSGLTRRRSKNFESSFTQRLWVVSMSRASGRLLGPHWPLLTIGGHPRVWLRPTEQTIDVVVTSNLTYDRCESYAARQDPLLTQPACYYHGLSALPHLDVSNGRPSLGYFNPVLRIVAMGGRVERLNEIADAIRAAAPAFTIRMEQQDLPQ